jgi:hypothetical protein
MAPGSMMVTRESPLHPALDRIRGNLLDPLGRIFLSGRWIGGLFCSRARTTEGGETEKDKEGDREQETRERCISPCFSHSFLLFISSSPPTPTFSLLSSLFSLLSSLFSLSSSQSHSLSHSHTHVVTHHPYTHMFIHQTHRRIPAHMRECTKATSLGKGKSKWES